MHPSAIITRSCDVTEIEHWTNDLPGIAIDTEGEAQSLAQTSGDPGTIHVPLRPSRIDQIPCGLYIAGWWIPMERKNVTGVLHYNPGGGRPFSKRRLLVQQFFLVKFLIVSKRIGVTKFDFRVLQVSTRYKDKKIRMLKRKEGVYLVRKEFVSTEGEEWKARELWFARTTSFAYLFRAGDSRLRSTLKSNFPLYAGHSLCSRDIRFFTLSKTSPNLRFLNFRGGLGGAFLGF